ncbi:centrosomal protein of 131 kDa [Periophthalmus magnuspinnatus]|uniref:centrosomal protein of 131 kDa n=1 Tax=Periophthalmus magnuspinnatus TaxID=409849 RepID=UPI00145BC6A6|nr:centrosomal protein of 131 kDa [Periophthalmus magnuspinnatus]
MHMTRSPTSPSALALPPSHMTPPPSGVSPGEALDLSISGSQITMMARRPSSASPGKTGKTFSRSVSVIGETRKHRNTLADSLGGSRSIKNLRRSNSTTQVNHTIGGRHSPEVRDEYLSLLNDGRKKLSPDTTTWNILDEQPRVLIQPSPRSSSSLDSQSGNKKREAGVCLAATFTANNRSNKGAVGNSVSTILHNNHHNTDKPLTPKSSNQRPSFNNLLKAGDGAGESSSVTKSQKNFSSCSPVLSAAPHRRQEATEEEAERFIEQVNHAAITIQRWYRLQRQRRQSNQTLNQTHHSQPQPPVQSELHQLLSSKRKEMEQRKLGDRKSEQHKDEERRRVREEKARLARLQAIQELQQKRTQRSLEPQFNSVEAEPSRNSGSKRGFKVGSETRLETRPESRPKTRPETGVQTRVIPESPGDKTQNHNDAQLNIDLSDLTFSAVSPTLSNHRRCTCEQRTCTEPVPEPVRLSVSRKKPPLICAPSHSPAFTANANTSTTAANTTTTNTTSANRSPAAPLSPSDNKANNTDTHLNIDLSDLTFRAVSPTSSNHRGSNCEQPLGHGPVSPSEQSRPQSKNTLTELLDSLRLLEEEPCKLQSNKKSYCKDNYTGTQDVDSPSLTADNLQRHVLQSFPPPDGGALLSEAKLQSIMSFLDEMEQSEQERPRSATSGSHKEMLLSEDELLAVEQASATAAELNGNMTRIRLELEEKNRSVHMLQAALAQQRELTVRHIKETEKELNRNFQLQKEQYESTIQRHLAFIDQLISDKKSLSERCEGVVSELKQVDSKYTKKIQQMQEQHDMVWQVLGPLCEEIKKLKELMAATEKVRREKWIDEKTKKIKEITVKGLEPEIQRLISRHKQELNKLRSLHEAELLQADERAALKYIQQTEELRERLEREREALCERERENVKSRYEKQLQEEELSLQQQRRRLYKEVSDEKERLAHLASRQRAELEELRRHLEENSSVASRALREELEKSREEQERRHQLEMKALQERLELERQTWEDTYKTKQQAWLRSQEREMKEELRRERDKEIELAIWTLEEQTSKEREESERAVENRVKRVREKYEAELQELERSERSSVEKHQETRQKLLQREEELMRATSELRLKDQTIQGLKQTCDKLTSERHSLAEVIREEFAERLVQTEVENRQLKTSVSELRARLRLELERVTREKEEELSQVHERVKAAILKKEETVNSLRKQHEAALKRADHLEALWEQQRKQLLEK